MGQGLGAMTTNTIASILSFLQEFSLSIAEWDGEEIFYYKEGYDRPFCSMEFITDIQAKIRWDIFEENLYLEKVPPFELKLKV